MRKQFIFIILVSAGITEVRAQSVSLVGLNLTGGPSIGNRYTLARNSNQVLPDPGYKVNYMQMDDSLDLHDSYRAGFDLTAGLMFSTFSRMYFSVGASYRNTGYRRHFKGLKYHDSIQYMGEIDVNSDNGSKDITMNYRYHYIDLPCLFHYSLKKQEDQFEETNYFISFGLAPNFLIRDDFRARLFGFSINEQVEFKGKDLYTVNKPFNLDFLLGGRFQGFIDEDWKFCINPMIHVPLMSQTTSGSGIDLRTWTVSLNAGVIYKFNN